MSQPSESPEPVSGISPAELNSSDDPIALVLTGLILPNLKAVQLSQAEQLAANGRLETAIADLRRHIDAQFVQLMAQLTACRAELAATQAVLKEAQARNGAMKVGSSGLVH